jgi:hypothetical protein
MTGLKNRYAKVPVWFHHLEQQGRSRIAAGSFHHHDPAERGVYIRLGVAEPPTRGGDVDGQNGHRLHGRRLLWTSLSRPVAGQVLPGDESLDIGTLSNIAEGPSPGTSSTNLWHKNPATLAEFAVGSTLLRIIARIVLRSKLMSNPRNAAISHSRLPGSGSPIAAATARFHETASSSEMASPWKR